jgi:hypothetical protein
LRILKRCKPCARLVCINRKSRHLKVEQQARNPASAVHLTRRNYVKAKSGIPQDGQRPHPPQAPAAYLVIDARLAVNRLREVVAAAPAQPPDAIGRTQTVWAAVDGQQGLQLARK